MIEISVSELKDRAEKVYEMLNECMLCPRNCKVNRLKGKLGYCKSGTLPKISSITSHFGEEPPITGKRGSGTIFFSNCTLQCTYCQNYQISIEGMGDEISDEALAEAMLELQALGCHNINLVTPTHFLHSILNALTIGIERGLKIPIVYNTSGYESVSVLKLLDGIVDIYLPDIKYSSNEYANEFSHAKNYVENNRASLIEMYSQVGDLKLDKGIAKRGILIRHLVLPNNIAGSFESLKFIKENLSNKTWLGIMSQYHPTSLVKDNKKINRAINREEYENVVNILEELDFENYFVQELESHRVGLPNFAEPKPFNWK